MSVLLIISVMISTTLIESDLHNEGRLSPEWFTVKYGSFNRPISEYDYSCVYSQPFDEDLLMNGYSNFSAGDRWLCDDFTLDFDSDIREIVFIELYTGQEAMHQNIVISIDDSGDSDPNTNTVIWEESVPCINWVYGWG